MLKYNQGKEKSITIPNGEVRLETKINGMYTERNDEMEAGEMAWLVKSFPYVYAHVSAHTHTQMCTYTTNIYNKLYPQIVKSTIL